MKPFHLKQFSIEQDSCAMKVTLDACLFGALCEIQQAQKILDIGTGTGLLALMSAQRSQASIDAIELDPAASQQAAKNVSNSRFSDRVRVYQQNIKEYLSPYVYDHIICNPPFFSDHLKGPNQQRNQARHNDQLSFSQLCQSMANHLSLDGKAWILLPCSEFIGFIQAANEQGLNLTQVWQLHSRPNKEAHRYVFSLEKASNENSKGVLALDKKQQVFIYQQTENHYSEQFKSLLADFYLKL